MGNSSSTSTKPNNPITQSSSNNSHAADNIHRHNISVDVSIDLTNELIRSYKSPTSPLKLKLTNHDVIESHTASFIQTLDGDQNELNNLQLLYSGKKKHSNVEQNSNALRLSLSDHDINYITTLHEHSPSMSNDINNNNNTQTQLKQYDSVSSSTHTHSNDTSTYIINENGTLIAGEFEIDSTGIHMHNPSQSIHNHNNNNTMNSASNNDKPCDTQSTSSKRSRHELNQWFVKQRSFHTHSPKSPKLNLLSPTLSYKSQSSHDIQSSNKSPCSETVTQQTISTMTQDLTPLSSTNTTDTICNTLDLCDSDLIILDTIGRGQNGSVYKALHKPTLTRIALKKMSVNDISHQHQLQHELHTMIHLHDSTYLVQFLGAYTNTGYVNLALEYMDCGSLVTFIKHNGALGADKQYIIQHIIKYILYGIQYLHSSHTIHRDIKPDNILLSHNGTIKITDFGLATELEPDMSTDTYVGTLAYLAPERLCTQQYSYSSDIWSLGLTVVYMCIGYIPEQFNDYWKLFDLVTRHDSLPIQLLDINDGWCTELIEFINLCLQYQPDKRPCATQLLQHPFVQKSFNNNNSIDITQCTEFKYSNTNNMNDITALLNILISQDLPIESDRLQQLSDEYDISIDDIMGRYNTLKHSKSILQQIQTNQ